MSQIEVYRIIMELGGRATTNQVANLLASRFPGLGLQVYVRRTLKRMERQGYIRHLGDDTWEIALKNKPSWAVGLTAGTGEG